MLRLVETRHDYMCMCVAQAFAVWSRWEWLLEAREDDGTCSAEVTGDTLNDTLRPNHYFTLREKNGPKHTPPFKSLGSA